MPLAQNYGYTNLCSDLDKLAVPYFEIGKSIEGRSLYMFKLGCGEKQIFFNGAHHGLEWLTTPVLIRFTLDCLNAIRKGTRLSGFDVEELFRRVTLHILPMVNPDGIEIAAQNPEKLWQSNARGVDLNHNYDAGFEIYKETEKKENILPGATRYSGAFPESEPETQAVCRYVRENPMDLCVALHSQGEVIYYEYFDLTPPSAKDICNLLCAQSGYLPDKTDRYSSYGGFKDWFIKEFRKPAFTFEIGKGKNPLPCYQFDGVYQKVLPLLLLAGFLG